MLKNSRTGVNIPSEKILTSNNERRVEITEEENNTIPTKTVTDVT